jgi:hypothetical protein
LPDGFAAEWAIAFQAALVEQVTLRFRELVLRWPIARAGYRYDNYAISERHIALVLHDESDPVVLAGPGQPKPLPISGELPTAMPAPLMGLWLAERLDLPSSSVVVVVERAMPVPRQLTDEQWASHKEEWDAQLSHALMRGLAHLASNPPPPLDRPAASQEIASSLYQTHPSFSEPTDLDGGLWRYISLGKFIDLVRRRELWFSRLDLVGDPLEGSLGSPNAERRRTTTPIPAEQLQATAEQLRGNSYVSCWHLSSHESAAMWAVYGQSGEAVAIRSSFRRLVEAIKGTEKFFAGQVTYSDYSSTFISETNALDRLMHKRASFEHEHEVRAVIARFTPAGPPTSGLHVPIDLDRLIERIHVAPTAPRWFLDVVTQLRAILAVSASVVRSDMDADPVW